jgi:hypothetical protein
MGEYLSAHGVVYTKKFVLDLADILNGVFDAEGAGFIPGDIRRALSYDWDATVEALAAGDMDGLTAIIAAATDAGTEEAP